MYCLDKRLDKILLTLPCLCGTRKFCCSMLNSSLLALRLHGLFTKERFSKYGRPTHLVSDWENSHHFFIQLEAKPKEHNMLAHLFTRFASGVKICLEFWLVRQVLWVLRDWQINYFCFGFLRLDIVGGAVASRLVRSNPHCAVWVRAQTGDIVLCSWARHFTLTVPLSSHVDKLVPANLMLRLTLRRMD